MNLDVIQIGNDFHVVSEATEEWRDIEGYEGLYQVSSYGRVKSLNYKRTKEERNLSPYGNGHGYLSVSLRKNSKTKKVLVHRLVAEAFLSDREEQINHKNGCKADNHVDNLEWCTQSENLLHAYRNGLNHSLYGESHPKTILVDSDVIDIRSKYDTGMYTQKCLAKMYNVAQSTVSDIINGKKWKHI